MKRIYQEKGRIAIKQRGKMAALCLVFVLSSLFIYACANNNPSSSTQGSVSESNSTNNSKVGGTMTAVLNKDAVYKSTELTIDKTANSIINFAYGGDRLYWYSLNAHGTYDIYRDYTISGSTLDGEEYQVLYSYGETIPPIGATVYSGDTRGAVQEMTADAAGNLYALTCGLSDAGEGYAETYWLIKWDAAGNELWSVEIENGGWSLGTPVCLESRLYIPFENTILVYSDTGNYEESYIIENAGEKIEMDDLSDRINDIFISSNGDVYLSYSSIYGVGRALVPFDSQTGEIGEPLPKEWKGFNMTPGLNSGYDVILRDKLSVYGWNFGDEDSVLLFNFLDSNMDSDSIGKLAAVGSGRFVTTCQTETEDTILCELTKVAPEDVRERQLLTVGTLVTYLPPIIKDIARFNRASEDYQVQLVDYAGYSDPLTQIALDIANGQAPDVFLINWYTNVDVPMEAYARQGAFENLFTWLESDAELDREDFLDNVFAANTIDGQLYYLSTGFSVTTYLAKTSVVGNNSSWSMDEMRQVEARYPDSTLIHITRSELLRSALAIRWQQFVDEENGTCGFDSEEFMELLEWVSEYPAETSASYGDMPYRSNEFLVAKANFRSFGEFNRNIEVMFGEEEITFIGLPGAEDNGSLIENEGIMLAISSKSKYKEGAWKFIRYYLSDDYQGDSMNRMNGKFPIRRSALEKLAGETINSIILDSYHLNGREVEVQPPSQQEIDRWIALIESIDQADLLDNDLYNIIAEEAEAYFVGQKTVSDVAEIIQGRVSIYVAERQ